MIADVALGILGNAVYDVGKLAVKKFFSQPLVDNAIVSTADEFPVIPGAEQALKLWCRSDDFAERLDAMRSGTIERTDDALVESFVETSDFYNGEHTTKTAARVLTRFFENVQLELSRTQDGLYIEGLRADRRHFETRASLDTMRNPQPMLWMPSLERTYENRFLYLEPLSPMWCLR